MGSTAQAAGRKFEKANLMLTEVNGRDGLLLVLALMMRLGILPTISLWNYGSYVEFLRCHKANGMGITLNR